MAVREIRVSQRDISCSEDAELKRVRSYLVRGRKLAGLPPADLDIEFATAFRIWTRDMDDIASRQAKDDAVSEYALRGAEPPYHLVQTELDRALRTIAEAVHGSMAVHRTRIVDVWSTAFGRGQGLPN